VSLIDHLESFLGPIDGAWQSTELSSTIRVAAFHQKPFDTADTYVTLGLSDEILPSGLGRDIRQELVFATYESFPKVAISSFLLTFAEYILSKRRALLRGDIVGPSEPIIPGVPLNAVYSTIPVIFSEGFATFGGTLPPTVLVWLLPLHGVEAEFVKRNGWNEFEEMLEAKDIDLLDLNRKSIL
jgi:hypothetical protein